MTVGRRYLGLVTLLVFSVSCAYFNTFYNAERYFKGAEKEIRKAGRETELSRKTTDALNKTVAKTSIVLEKYPDSRFRDDALLLQGKALYYLGDYSRALEAFRRITDGELDTPLKGEARVWTVLCRVKLGDQVQALGEVKELLNSESGLPGPILALAFETAAEIHLELHNVDSAIHYFDQSARYLRRGSEQSRLYLIIAELAFRDSLYDSAREYYEKVIQQSADTHQVEKAHLQIVKITRIQQKWDETTSEIQRLLLSEKFSDIRPQLYLELAKLYEMQSRFTEGINRLELITQEFPRTEMSAEAYFHLGRLTLATRARYEQARKYYEKVSSEARSSIFAPSARAKVKEIDAILLVVKRIGELEESLGEANEVHGDSVLLDSTGLLHELAEKLYSQGELLAFHFDKPDSGIRIFERLVNEIPSSPKRAKALFSLAQLYWRKGDSEKAERYARQLVEDYPFTEFAERASASLGLKMHDDAEDILEKAEKLSDTDPERSLRIYQTVLEQFPSSRFVPVALLASGNVHDLELNDLDSSLFFYERLIEEFPRSDQARYIEERYQVLRRLRESRSDTSQHAVPRALEGGPERED
ncbi:MAG: tetratricopeptide repeat protein [Candidatus Neomarinimicrobiota bacterium]